MGCGKTTIGKKLAQKLKIEFEDTDFLIEEMAGASVADIFHYEGESKFRELEAAVLRRIASIDSPTIVATGGGLPIYGDNMELLNRLGDTFYIKRGATQIVKRLTPFGLKKRPKLSGLKGDELLDFMSNEINQRDPIYMKAKYVADCSSMRDSSIVEYIISNLDYGK